MKFVLCDFEKNGYNDSDFFLTYYDDVEDKLVVYEYDTTRFAGCTCKGTSPPPPAGHRYSAYHYHGTPPEFFLWPTLEIVEKARVKLEDFIFNALKHADENLVYHPDVSALRQGLRMRLLKETKNSIYDAEDCQKCSASGKWINPKNSSDVRSCFYCKGNGKIFSSIKKDERGKRQYDKIKVGMVGEVVNWRSFGQFYKSGYNKPGPDNTQVSLRSDDGRCFRATLANLRMDREPASEHSLRARAKELSFNYQFGSLGPCAWLTHNFALQVVEDHKKQMAINSY